MSKILIVDDEQPNRYLLQVLLQNNGYALDIAANGAEALTLARRAPPDLIISDILMPVMDGFSFCRACKQDPQLQHIPFIFYTATYTDPKDEAFALSLGAERFLLKPAEPVELIAILRETLAATATDQRPTAVTAPQLDSDYYQQHNQALIRKLEAKMQQLETANRVLEQEIVERKQIEASLRRLNRMYATLSDVNQTIVRVRQLPALFDDICRIAIANGEFLLVWVGLLDDTGQLRIAAQAGPAVAQLEEAGVVVGSALTAGCPVRNTLHSGEHTIARTLEPWAPCQRIVARLGARSVAAFPLSVAGQMCGVVNFYASDPDFFDAGEVRLLDELALDVSFALEFVHKEEERERLLAQIQAQAQQIGQILDAVPEGVVLLDAQGQVLLTNLAGQRDLATLAGDAVGQPLTSLAGRPLAELLAMTQHDEAPRELRVGARIFEVALRPLTAQEQWVLVIQDVTQTRHLRQQLEQQERLAAIGQLAAGVAHDFNNILAIIALHAPLLAQAPGLTERDRERLAVISEQTTQASQLVQQMLDFSRRAVMERQPLDLAPLLKEHVKLLARTLPETITVTLHCTPGEFIVLADPTRLQQALMNLAVNARDAMPNGGALRLTLASQATPPRPDLPTGPWARLEVNDSGSGISPETLAHIFEPFFTTKPRGQGTGLGLAQVYGIVKQHGGEINVHSAPDQGAMFVLFLPLIAAQVAAPAAPAGATQQGRGETILIVEDNLALLDALRDIVEMLGYRVITANNGAEALIMLAADAGRIALVLSDLIMPVMGGEALLAAMRARGLAIPVVMLSGHPLKNELQALRVHGLAGWLLKPPDIDQLAHLLAQALASS